MPIPNLVALAFAVQEAKGELTIYEEAIKADHGNFDSTVYDDMLRQYRMASERLSRAIVAQLRLHQDRYPEDWEVQFARVLASALEKAGEEE